MSKTESRWNKIGDYPREFRKRSTVNSVLSCVGFTEDTPHGIAFNIAGRIIARRNHGNNVFFDLEDQTGRIQLHCKKEKGSGEIDEAFSNRLKNKDWEAVQDCDLGDMVGVTGTLGKNPRGEPLLAISNWTLLAKALREPPDKHHGIADAGVKYRHRELDLLSSPDSRELFKKRSEIIHEIRTYLNARDYVEIECPVLQPVYGGATAEPFKTKHNALGQDFFLSISSELYLKRALVGGFDRVYSVSRCFRNEGISPEHNPEFTNVEFFATCETYETMARLTEELLQHLFRKFTGDPLIELDRHMNLKSADWPLSRKYPADETLSEAWEMFVGGMEIASGASDLNSPVEQKERLYRAYSPGDEGYNPYDENYIEALEQGLLPVAGVGIGLDRLVMLLTNKHNIRDVIMFPTLKSIE